MNLTELNDTERKAMAAALYLVINADGRVRRHERDEVEALAVELDDPKLVDQVRQAGEKVRDVDDLQPLVHAVEREDARELIRTVLFDAAHADGSRSKLENEVINLITREWARR